MCQVAHPLGHWGVGICARVMRGTTLCQMSRSSTDTCALGRSPVSSSGPANTLTQKSQSDQTSAVPHRAAFSSAVTETQRKPLEPDLAYAYAMLMLLL